MIRKKKHSAVGPVYRFKIWTRKRYSVFNSLGKLISIGFLSTDLSEKIGAKSTLAAKDPESHKGKIPTPDEPGGYKELSFPLLLHTPLAGFLMALLLACFSPARENSCECHQCRLESRISSTPSFPLFTNLIPFHFLSFHFPNEDHNSICIFLITNYKSQFIYSNQTIYVYET